MKRNSSMRLLHPPSNPLTSFRHVMKVAWIHIYRSSHGKRLSSTISAMTSISFSVAWTQACFWSRHSEEDGISHVYLIHKQLVLALLEEELRFRLWGFTGRDFHGYIHIAMRF